MRDKGSFSIALDIYEDQLVHSSKCGHTGAPQSNAKAVPVSHALPQAMAVAKVKAFYHQWATGIIDGKVRTSGHLVFVQQDAKEKHVCSHLG